VPWRSRRLTRPSRRSPANPRRTSRSVSGPRPRLLPPTPSTSERCVSAGRPRHRSYASRSDVRRRRTKPMTDALGTRSAPCSHREPRKQPTGRSSNRCTILKGAEGDES